jgi:hypothetical protein
MPPQNQTRFQAAAESCLGSSRRDSPSRGRAGWGCDTLRGGLSRSRISYARRLKCQISRIPSVANAISPVPNKLPTARPRRGRTSGRSQRIGPSRHRRGSLPAPAELVEAGLPRSVMRARFRVGLDWALFLVIDELAEFAGEIV